MSQTVSSCEAQNSQECEDELIDKLLHHYLIEKRVGHGGMSIVYRAKDLYLNRTVAVKILYPFLAEKEEFRARLAREAHAVARLEHPHILRIFDYSGDVSTLEERPANKQNLYPELQKVSNALSKAYIVTEFVDGDTLKVFATKHQLWKCPELAAYCIWQVAQALEHAHMKGVVHRDLKPENIMMRNDQTIKLMDFGIAQVSEAQSLTLTGTLLGSPAHMAPECIEGKEINEQSDIFSLGTVLYWLCTGQLPFQANSPHALLKAIVDGRCKPAQQYNTLIHDNLAIIIEKSMSRDTAQRYKNVQELLQALQEFILISQEQCSSKHLKKMLKRYLRNREAFTHHIYQSYLDTTKTHINDLQQTALLCSNISRLMAEKTDDPQTALLLEQLGDAPQVEINTINSEQHIQALMNHTETLDALPTTAQKTTIWKNPLLLFVALLTLSSLILFIIINSKQNLKHKTTFSKEPTSTLKNPKKSVTHKKFETQKVPIPFPNSNQKLRPKNHLTSNDKAKVTKLEKLKIKRKMAKKERLKKADELARLKVLKSTQKTQEAASNKEQARDYKINIQINIPSTLLIDGNKKYSVLGQKTITLSAGKHTLEFSNPATFPLKKEIMIVKDQKTQSLQIRLKAKPALLKVMSTIDGRFTNAEIILKNKSSAKLRVLGSSLKSIGRALPVYFASKNNKIQGTQHFEVLVKAKNGYFWRGEIILIAGREKTIFPQLSPPE